MAALLMAMVSGILVNDFAIIDRHTSLQLNNPDSVPGFSPKMRPPLKFAILCSGSDYPILECAILD
jgi:hypothetical protein